MSVSFVRRGLFGTRTGPIEWFLLMMATLPFSVEIRDKFSADFVGGRDRGPVKRWPDVSATDGKLRPERKFFWRTSQSFLLFFCGESDHQTWGKDTSADGGITFLFGKFNSNSPIELVHCCCIFRNFKRLGNQRFFPTNVLQWNHNLKTYSKHFWYETIQLLNLIEHSLLTKVPARRPILS